MTTPAQPRRVSQEELDAAIATWNRACAEGMIVEGDPGIPFDRRVVYTVAPQPEAVSAPGELWVNWYGKTGNAYVDEKTARGSAMPSAITIEYTRADLAQPDPSGVVGGFDVEKLIAAWQISNIDTPYFLRDWFARHAPNTNARQPEATPARLGDVEQMIRECIPGGSICDPQRVADNIRAWSAEEARKAPAGNDFTSMLLSVIADVNRELGISDEEAACANGSAEMVAAIRDLKAPAGKDAALHAVRLKGVAAHIRARAAEYANLQGDADWIEEAERFLHSVTTPKLRPIPLSVRKPTREDADEHGHVLWTWCERSLRKWHAGGLGDTWGDHEKVGWLPLNAAHIDTSAL